MQTTVRGVPAGSRAWRSAVAGAAVGLAADGDGVLLSFTLPPRRWVDLDTLAASTLAGLRDAGVLSPRLAGLDAVVATKSSGQPPGLTVRRPGAPALRRRRPPGPAAVTVASVALPRPGRPAAKAAWRDAVAATWARRPVLAGDVWADVALRVGGSLLGPLEVVLDGLEPVLGRDPRGRDWQDFFPNDHLVTWLRVTRSTRGPALRLTLGPQVARP